MNAPTKLSIVDQIRARDGDHCWLCNGTLDFAAKPNSKRAPTKEHLVAQSLGGGNELSNLVLCHPGCNRMLADRPVADKEKIRAKLAANRAKVAAAKKAGVPVPSNSPASVKATEKAGALSPPIAPAPLQRNAATRAGPPALRLEAQLWRWQMISLVSAGAAMLAIGVLIGLALAA
ncbi:hypothetical protein [Sphingomonas sp. LHG3406-1]|uniref:HNH endonuclease n=1 Tax=Sphingomonas sp. LHG3406-1 TaxID=2804617 RepID=UPI00261FD83F|nr:hypothetical protein [Sphingomonas sp. LHG3406-1]